MNFTPVTWTNVTEDGAVKTTTGILHSVILTAGSDAASAILYDNASAASGTVLATVKVASGETVQVTLNRPCTAGIYADVSGTGPLLYVAHV